jgi:RNA polymerase sigma-70 factor (ECF subfamily)
MTAAERRDALARARQGDRDAWGALLESFRPYLWAVIVAVRDARLRHRVGDSDLVQDALLAASQGLERFRGGTVAELALWLRRIAVRTVAQATRTHLGAQKRSLALEQAAAADLASLAGPGSSPSAQAVRQEEAARVAEALAQLPEDMRAVVLARHVEDRPHAVIAAELGRSEGAVRVLYVRAVQRLRALLEPSAD